jgi:hypothetical protein
MNKYQEIWRRIFYFSLILIVSIGCNLPFFNPGRSGTESVSLLTQLAQAANQTINAQVSQENITSSLTLPAATQSATMTATSTNLGVIATLTATATAPVISNPTTAVPPAPSQRINFDRGATSAVVQGSIKASETVDYVINALKDQWMEISVFSPGNNVSVGVAGISDGIPLQRTTAELANFRGVLPASQDYRISLKSNGTATDYSVQVIIPVRIRFQPGGTSANLDGTLKKDSTNFYLVRASGGQTMTVRIHSPHNDVLLTIYGLTDGSPLVRYVSGAWEWTGVLPGTQDYMIEARATRAATDYVLEVIII